MLLTCSKSFGKFDYIDYIWISMFCFNLVILSSNNIKA